MRARPGYPYSVIDLLRAEIGLTPAQLVADVGSGTGISALPFLRHGNVVYGVEPNADMRVAAERQLAGYDRFRSVAGSAEATTLTSSSVDVIVVAQAFHWFDVAGARGEFERILRDGGRVVLLWNTRRAEGSEFLRGYESLLQQFGTDYAQVMQRTNSLTSGAATAGGAGLHAFFCGGYERHVLDNGQDLDLHGLQSRLRSASYMPAEDSAAYPAMMAALSALFERTQQHGMVRLEYDLEIFIGQLS